MFDEFSKHKEDLIKSLEGNKYEGHNQSVYYDRLSTGNKTYPTREEMLIAMEIDYNRKISKDFKVFSSTGMDGNKYYHIRFNFER